RPHEVGPQLPREVELDVDLEGLRDVDAPVATRRGVIELTERGVAGAGVVPGARALLSFLLQHFEHLDPEIGLKLLQKNAQGRAHDAGPDEDDVHLVRARLAGRLRYGSTGHCSTSRLLIEADATVVPGR